MTENEQASTDDGSAGAANGFSPSLFSPSSEEVEFLKDQTGIQNEDELRQHVLSVQKEAWNVVHYNCIRSFGFTRLKISRLPAYRDLLTLGKERADAIFIDFACCFGNDARKVIADGYPQENVLASDIEKAFWGLGHKLFKSTPESFRIPFIPGDVFDPLHIAPAQPYYSPPTTPRPTLSMLTSLTPLQGYVSAIHVSAFFHLFDEAEQLTAARALASLLSPLTGSMIFGAHSSALVSGLRETPNVRGRHIYCYSPEDWRALWDGVIFAKGTVEVEAALVDSASWRGRVHTNEADLGKETMWRSMVWHVKRV
ncbi:hypothetical protein DFH11DRAFT_1702203 [Phellopilus nigrolimitatus]|nr:hypothetical protein DFH11DRAFT_1702203 [Phellopilus nigrolimitatus]